MQYNAGAIYRLLIIYPKYLYMFVVSIIGRPNVGKSTLFNRLIGKKHALVDDQPGVTRDRREGLATLGGETFRVIDTAGLENAKESPLAVRMMEQTQAAVNMSDVCLLMVDGRAGVTPMDRHFINWARQIGKPTAILVNKCEGIKGNDGYMEALNLGFKDVIPISAEHNEGMANLFDFIFEYKKIYDKKIDTLNAVEVGHAIPENAQVLQLAVLGRPNAGKSTFMNQLLKDNRLLVGPEAGITRDSIAIDWNYKGHLIKLIDTAGIRRKANVQEKLEKLSVADALRALTFAHVAVLMIDALIPLEKQDLSVAELIIREGRAIVLAVNKWDLVKDKKAALEELEYQVNKLLPTVKGIPVITISALEGNNVYTVIDAALKAYEIWNKRFPTAAMNEWLRQVQDKHIPPLSHNKRRIRLKYITQGNTRPPTFTLFVNYPEDLPDSYKRYLINDLRSVFDLQGVPIRMMLRKSENPYATRQKKKM